MNHHADEVAAKKRFQFGKNWMVFAKSVDEERIKLAEDSLKAMLKVNDLVGKRFLDVGCGSGLFSLAARRLGAVVHSFDYDPDSVACTRELKQRFLVRDEFWTIEHGSVLDTTYLDQVGKFDIVYSWGVLHHTGAMWKAMENITTPVSEKGLLFISIYNHQQFLSSYWRCVKRLYNVAPKLIKKILEIGFYIYFVLGLFIFDILRLRNPLNRHSGRGRRGMRIFNDIVDWIGGWPFEVATPEEIFRFYRDKGFFLAEMKTCGGKMGCNEFVFVHSGTH